MSPNSNGPPGSEKEKPRIRLVYSRRGKGKAREWGNKYSSGSGNYRHDVLLLVEGVTSIPPRWEWSCTERLNSGFTFQLNIISISFQLLFSEYFWCCIFFVWVITHELTKLCSLSVPIIATKDSTIYYIGHQVLWSLLSDSISTLVRTVFSISNLVMDSIQ